MLLAAASLLALFSSRTGGLGTVFAGGLALLPSGVQADNWLNSQSRAKSAPTTVKPLPERVDPNPQVMVTVGQEFEVEWAAAHGRESYFALIKAEDEPKLTTLQVTDMITYLAECPEAANFMASADLKSQKFTRRSNAGDPAMFAETLTPADPDFSARPQSLVNHALKVGRNPKNVPSTMRFSPSAVAQDKRCAYASTKFPYLLQGLHLYARHQGVEPGDRRGALPRGAQGE